jgi:hypothetical protein
MTDPDPCPICNDAPVTVGADGEPWVCPACVLGDADDAHGSPPASQAPLVASLADECHRLRTGVADREALIAAQDRMLAAKAMMLANHHELEAALREQVSQLEGVLAAAERDRDWWRRQARRWERMADRAQPLILSLSQQVAGLRDMPARLAAGAAN